MKKHISIAQNVEQSEKSEKREKSEKSARTEKPKKKTPKKNDSLSSITESSSHTLYYRKPRLGNTKSFERITRDKYLNIPESISSTDTFECFHKGGRQYSPEVLLEKNLVKKLDRVPVDRCWTKECPQVCDWELSKKLVFLLTDPAAKIQTDRLYECLRDFAKLSADGYRIDVLDDVMVIIETLLNDLEYHEGDKTDEKLRREYVIELIKHLKKPIKLILEDDVVTYLSNVEHYLGFMCFLLVRVEEEDIFELVSEAILWHMRTPDSERIPGCVRRRHVLVAAKSLIAPVCRMLATTQLHRYPTFLELALILATCSEENCIIMMKEDVIENIFSRFNPYFPQPLPEYNINIVHPQGVNTHLGGSSLHIDLVLSILLVLLKTTVGYLDKHPEERRHLRCPDKYSSRCFAWGYRYEILSRNHDHQRIMGTIIAAALVNCFRDRMRFFTTLILPDIMSLSILTEVPQPHEWFGKITFTALQQDVTFKKVLITAVVLMLRMFPDNNFLVSSKYWLLGLMYLLDPSLSRLRKHWSPGHYAELRKTAFQALICTIPICDPALIKGYSMLRKLMWYIEWYTNNQYNINELYWCIRLLQTIIAYRDCQINKTSVQDLYDTHGIIILSRLCFTLMEQKLPPIEKAQAVIVVCLRMITAAVETDQKRRIVCSVYPNIQWPQIIFPLARKMMDIIMYSLERHLYISDRWLIALLNFTWEAVIWNNEYRELFVEANGVYMILDMISVTRPSVQCIGLALLCDILRSGRGVGQLVTWRGRTRSISNDQVLANRTATIGSLLAIIFREECQTYLKLSEEGILELEDEESLKGEKATQTPALKNWLDLHSICSETAFDMAGSRRSKVFALFHLLSNDLQMKLDVADESYNLYKNIILDERDEITLVLCSHYLTMKLNDTWQEINKEYNQLLLYNKQEVGEFLQLDRGWKKEINRQQNDVLEKHMKKHISEEYSLYALIRRVQLNIALDALKAVRCMARSSDPKHKALEMMMDAVNAHRKVAAMAQQMHIPILKTYKAPLDEANRVGQNINVCSLHPKEAVRGDNGNGPSTSETGK